MAGEGSMPTGREKGRRWHGEGDPAWGRRSSTGMPNLAGGNFDLAWGRRCRHASAGTGESTGEEGEADGKNFFDRSLQEDIVLAMADSWDKIFWLIITRKHSISDG